MKTLFTAALVSVAFTACSSGGGVLSQGPLPTSNLTQPSSIGSVPTYRLVVLGNGLIPNKINNAGIVVGLDLNTNHPRPFEYKDGRVTVLPLWPGDTDGNVFDVNNHDQVVGQTLNPAAVGQFGSDNPCFGTCPEAHAVLYDHERISNLGSVQQQPGGPAPVFNSAEVINDNGVIAGESGDIREGGLINLVIFSPGTIRTFLDAQFFETLQEGPRGPIEVNNAGEIVGAGQSIFFPVLLAYPNAIACTPPLEPRHNGFFGINNAGDTISADFFSGANAVYCERGVGHQLQLFPSALNDGGDIVGSALAAQPETYSRGAFHKIAATSGTRFGRYFVSRDRALEGYVLSVSPGDALLFSKGSYFDLNDLVANHPELILQNATSINNRREIVGATVTASSQEVGWLLVPQ